MRTHDTLSLALALARAFAVATGLSACHAPTSVPPPVATISETPTIVGTVRRLDLEGGCWVIDTPTGRIQPVELPAEFRIDGLAVEVTFDDAPDVLSACQAGEPKRIRDVRRQPN